MTLNNYLAQALLTHVYVIILLPYLFKRDLSEKFILLRGWLIGLVLVFLALLTQKYYARIFDYSFPLMFVLFGLYWSKKRPFRIIVVTLTIAFLIISQLMIFHDPFTMRRYYNVDEMDSAKNVIGLGLDGVFASDLRTSALFSYLDKKDVLFGNSGEPLHDKLFYEYQNITDLNVNYVILSKYMKYIVYDANFETKPISDEVFGYYDSNFEKVYDDEVLKVYKITHNPIKSLGNSTI